jgi:hypothetical protein
VARFARDLEDMGETVAVKQMAESPPTVHAEFIEVGRELFVS